MTHTSGQQLSVIAAHNTQRAMLRMIRRLVAEMREDERAARIENEVISNE